MTNINLSWIVKLVLIMVVIGVALGILFYRNLDSDKPAVGVTPVTTSQPGPATQPAVMVPYISPAAIDRMFYPFQKALDLTRQFDGLRITTAERLNEIAEKQVEIRGQEKELDLQRNISQQQADQNRDLQRTLAHVAIGAGLALVAAVAMSLIIYAMFAGWGRLKVSSARAAQITAQTQAAALDAKASDQQEQLNQIWRSVGELTHQQTQLKNEFTAKQQAAAGTLPNMPSPRKYDELPLAVMKDD
jgi:hypothetical protein